MPLNERLGLDAKLYRNTGTYAAPTWAEMSNVVDVKVGMERGSADASTRGTGGWRRKIPTLKEATLEFHMLWKTGDTHLDAIRAAYHAGTTVELLVLSGDVAESDNEGLRATWAVTSFAKSEALEEAQAFDVKLEVGVSDHSPETYVVA